MLGLPPDQASDALALALCQANIPGQSRRGAESHVRAVRKGFAACAAVSAVLLARAGVRGFPQPLEGDGGFVATVAGGSYDEADMLDDLGSAEIGPIEEMLVEPASARTASANSIDAKFSIPFTTATALVHGAVGLDSFSENARKDPAVLALARMVRSVRRADWTRAHAASGALTLELAGIGPLRIEIAQAAGHFEYPVSDADLVAKFVACAVRAESPLDDEPALALAARLLPAERMTSTADLLV